MLHTLPRAIKKIWVLLVAISLSRPVLAMAQGIKGAEGELAKVGSQIPGVETELGTITGRAVNAALSLVGLIFLLLMVYGGYLWMTARGEESQVEKAQDIIIAAVIGLVIVVSAYAITFLVTGRFDSAG